MVFKYCLKIAPRLSGSHKSVLLLPATLLRAEEHLLATEIAKSVVMRWLALRTFGVQGKGV